MSDDAFKTAGTSPPTSEFMTIAELSVYLQMKKKTLYGMLHEIPHFRFGRLLRFKKNEIDAWADSRKVENIKIKCYLAPQTPKTKPFKRKGVVHGLV
jgi:excisionase family DNA binding protein